MGQIIGGAAKPKRCNINRLSQLGTPAAGEYILVSCDNSMNAAGQGNFDCYIVGDGTTAATALELQYLDGGISKALFGTTTHYENSIEINNKYIDRNGNIVSYNSYFYTFPIYVSTKDIIHYSFVGSGVSYISKASGESDEGPYTSLKYGNVTGNTFTPTENGWYVFSGKNLSYLYKETPGLFDNVSDLQKILTEDKVVNDLISGGEDVPLSAEQGKVLNESVSVLNRYSVPLRLGTINNIGYQMSSHNYAWCVIENSGFKTISINDNYEYILYGANISDYTGAALTTIVSNYTSEPYVNTSSFSYFWILVRKNTQENILIDELFDIITIESDSDDYDFKALNNVNGYSKLGKQIPITDFDIIEGERWGDNGGTKTYSSYNRTSYIDVKGLFALKIHTYSTNDTVSFSTSLKCKWLDEEYNPCGMSCYYLKRSEAIIVVGVPKFASYVSINDFKGKTLYGFKKEDTVTNAHYYNTSVDLIAKLPKVSLILMYGQSLSTGSDASVISFIQKYSALKMLNGYGPHSLGNLAFQELAPANDTPAENPVYGLGEMFIEAIQKENGISVFANEWERHYIVLASCGAGQSNITQLTDDALYVNVEKAITNTKNLCDEFGFTLEIPAWCWFQGEQDMKAVPESGVPAISTPDEYKSAVLALHEKVCASISTIAGITKRPKCCIYQPASQCLYTQTYNFANSYLAFNNAYVELLRDNDEFIACAPVYIFDGSDPDHVPPSGNQYGGFVHLDARGYKTLGAYAGYSIKKALIDGVKVKGVIPIDITVDGTTISIKYNVPCPPLKFDTEWVKEPPLTNGVHNYGFNVVKSDDTELITNVSVFDDTVTIECSESPIGAKLRYGLNGDVYRYPGSSYNGADGRIHGGRGNLRDSQGDYVQKEIRELGQIMRLDNWAYCFEELLSE